MNLKTIAKNTSIIFGGQILSKIISLISILLIARYLNKEDFGFFSWTVAYWASIMVLVEAGTGGLIVCDVAKDHSITREYYGVTVLFKLVLAGITLLLSLLFLALFGIPIGSGKWIFFILVGLSQYILQIFVFTFTVFVRAHQQFRIEATLSIIVSLVTVFPLLVVIYYQLNLIDIGWLYIIGSMFGAFIARRFFTLVQGVHIFNKFSELSGYIRKLKEYTFSYIVSGLLQRVSTMQIGFYANEISVASFAASMRLIEGLSFVPTSLMGVSFPTFSQLHSTNKEKLNLYLKLSFEILLFIGTPFILFLGMMSNEIIKILYNNKYNDSADTFVVLSIWFLFWTLKSHLHVFMMSVGLQKVSAIINSVGLCILLILGILLIPTLSYFGGAISVLISELVMFVLSWYYISNENIHIVVLRSVLNLIAINIAFAGILIAAKVFSLLLFLPLFFLAVLFHVFFYLKKIKRDVGNASFA